jgi:uncharacterized protein
MMARREDHGERSASPVVYVDTSALYATIVADDPDHGAAASTFSQLRGEAAVLRTTSYVLVETTALLQARVGVRAVRALHDDLRAVLEVTWVEQYLHDAAMAALLAADKRRQSLVDWVGFSLMRQEGIATAFAFDDDFSAEGFQLVP